jgi:hypothetical protein
MPDAVVVDTSDHTVPEVIDEIRRLLLERGAVLRSSTSESDSETGDAADRLSS